MLIIFIIFVLITIQILSIQLCVGDRKILIKNISSFKNRIRSNHSSLWYSSNLIEFTIFYYYPDVSVSSSEFFLNKGILCTKRNTDSRRIHISIKNNDLDLGGTGISLKKTHTAFVQVEEFFIIKNKAIKQISQSIGLFILPVYRWPFAIKTCRGFFLTVLLLALSFVDV